MTDTPDSAQDNLVSIRAAQRDDSALIVQFIRALADYERLGSECQVSAKQVETTLFGESPAAEVVIAYRGETPAGFALFFRNYSTFLALPGLYLEDLFVDEAHRGCGVGQALLEHLAGIAVARGYGRFEWSVLDWNENAIRFYERLGARAMSDWTVYRVTGDELVSLAKSPSVTGAILPSTTNHGTA